MTGVIWVHLAAAVLAAALGLTNLVSEKGTFRHRVIGWCWLALMALVTVPSFWIREVNEGRFSWIHLLTVFTIICMGAAIVAIRTGRVRTHAGFMIGTMTGAVIAGGFAMAPGRFLSTVLGYG